MKKFLLLTFLLFTGTAFAADTPVACQGASCAVKIVTRDASNVGVTAGTFSGGAAPLLSLTNPLAVTSGGSGLNVGTAGGVPYFATTTTMASTAQLASTQILVGSSGGVPTPRTITGDVTIGNTGVTAIASGVIVDADVNASAAISTTKLSAAHSTLGATPTSGDLLIKSGTFTPAFTNLANANAASPVIRAMYWIQVGSIVTCTGAVRVTLTAGAPTATSFRLTVPVLPTSPFGSVADAAGLMNFYPTTGAVNIGGYIYATVGGNEVTFDFAGNSVASNRDITYTFSYKI